MGKGSTPKAILSFTNCLAAPPRNAGDFEVHRCAARTVGCLLSASGLAQARACICLVMARLLHLATRLPCRFDGRNGRSVNAKMQTIVSRFDRRDGRR